MSLGLTPAVLDTVEKDFSAVAERKRDMLKRWLKLSTEAAWEDVVSALEKIGDNRVAECIKVKYCDGGDTHAAGLNKQ